MCSFLELVAAQRVAGFELTICAVCVSEIPGSSVRRCFLGIFRRLGQNLPPAILAGRLGSQHHQTRVAG